MNEAPLSRLTPSVPKRNGQLTGTARDKRTPCDSLLKLRAVLVLLSAKQGTKAKVVEDLVREFERRGVKSSARSIYRWSRQYACFGPAGLSRRRRCDCGIRRLRRDENGLRARA